MSLMKKICISNYFVRIYNSGGRMDIYDKYKNKELIETLNDDFDIELDKYKVYNQGNSLTCWIYAAFNTIKRDIAKSLNLDEDKLDFSVNYISFYDRIEKLNKIYDEIITKDYDLFNIKYLLFNYVNTCGDFNSFKYLVNKYGIVFDNQMPMNDNCYKPKDIDNLLIQKVIFDIEEIINKKNKGYNLLGLKKKYMIENYNILEQIYGKPPKETIINNLKLPVKEFYNKCVKNIFDDYISLCCLDNLEYNKNYNISFLDMKIDEEKYLNLELSSVKQTIIKSLKDNRPVWFGCSFRYMSGSYKNKDGILADNLYMFDKIDIKKLPKNLAEKYNVLDYSHAMIFTGYDNKNGKRKWQVCNTFGEENNRNGYFIMSDDFFNSSVFMFAINKKYLQL